ncbi:hypothetical protein ASG22_01980 [Chryseobacterium sp. Leaf405]|nr:hypothetical protein ASG22_01980 [Chryseobacterium sp. Leaf405]
MHPHINDEILTYIRSGYVEHIDYEGIIANLDNKKLMLMKAGKIFQHEEEIIDKGEPLEALQIFIRPKEKDLKPIVTFLDLENDKSENQWRSIALPSPESPLQFTSRIIMPDFFFLTEELFFTKFFRFTDRFD